MKAFYGLRNFENILRAYKFEQPLHRFLKTFYAFNKQMGSKDRKVASNYIFSWFRLGRALSYLADETRLAIACYLCNNDTGELVKLYTPELADTGNSDLMRRIDAVHAIFPHFDCKEIFPLYALLSEDIDSRSFAISHLLVPKVYIRLLKRNSQIIAKLEELGGEQTDAHIWAFNAATKIDAALNAGEYYVQDINSQRTAELYNACDNELWWDCCAASGGKSMLLKTTANVRLYASDIRESMLKNFKNRLSTAGIKAEHIFIADMEDGSMPQALPLMDGIIVDAPCSGSGTWGRTPEMLSWFTEDMLDTYVRRQKAIGLNAAKKLKTGKPLVYITCSVFSRENEEVVDYLINSGGLALERMEYFKGYQSQADTLFAARLIKQ